jgi:hypothetical protein
MHDPEVQFTITLLSSLGLCGLELREREYATLAAGNMMGLGDGATDCNNKKMLRVIFIESIVQERSIPSALAEYLRRPQLKLVHWAQERVGLEM